MGSASPATATKLPRLALVMGAASFLCATPSLAQEDEAAWADDEAGWGDEGEDDDAGFGDPEPSSTAVAPATPAATSPLVFSGFLRSEEAAWTERLDKEPIAKARQNIDLTARYKSGDLLLHLSGHGEYDLAYQVDRDDYDTSTLEAYEWQALLRQAYLGYSLGPVELTLGRQIVAWGEGDAISPLDVVNPRDMREPGIADLDDIRVPITASRLGYFAGDHRFEVMVLHEPHWGFRSPPKGPYGTLEAMLDETQDAPADLPAGAPTLAMPTLQSILGDAEINYVHKRTKWATDNQQYLLRWVYKGSGIDLGLYAASLLLREGVMKLPAFSPLAGLPESIDITLQHPRYTMVGHSGAWASGSFLFKWELAYNIGKPMNTLNNDGPIPSLQSSEVDNLSGALVVGYNGVSDSTFNLELGKTQLLEDIGEQLFDSETPTIALRSSHKFLKENLILNIGATVFGLQAEQGFLARGDLTYSIADGIKVGMGYITYQPGDEVGFMTGLDDHDRAFVKLRWDFQS